MKVTLNWLKQYVDFDWSPDELAERLTMLGLEVEGIETTGGGFEGVVVAEVLTREPHPNADRLSVCKVNDGGQERQIVCGASNFKPGDKVPLILPGASLPAEPGAKPFTIKVGKIRGVESQGMMCSPKELGVAGDADGLLILKSEAKVGQPFADYLGRGETDHVFDLEITPNRPDLNSVIGIAREIAAVTGNPLRFPDTTLPDPQIASDTQAGSLVSVRNEAGELCPRYTARVIKGVRVGPSPDWLRNALEKVGLRSINNVVDVTNYVMLETGQPLHAFDYHLLAKGKEGKPEVVIRRATEGENFTTLDEGEHELSGDMLLIADPEKGIALAGVMGGLNTEINDRTTDVLIESACFDASNIRRTSKALGLRTDSSYRFERGADIGITSRAGERAARLILETAGGTAAAGVVDDFARPPESRTISLRFVRTDSLLGITVPADRQVAHLERLELKAIENNQEAASFQIPTFRIDLKRETDLIEEVVRLHGVDNVPPTPPRGAIGSNEFDAVYDVLMEARRILCGLGFNEAQGQTLVSGQAAAKFFPEEEIVRLENPLSSDMDVLRPGLLPGLLDVLRHNARQRELSAWLFEIGRTFKQHHGGTREHRRLGLAMTGNRSSAFWNDGQGEAATDIYDLKGALDVFLEQFGVRGVQIQRMDKPWGASVESAEIRLGGKLFIGHLGLMHPATARAYDLRHSVLLAELDLDQLIARRKPDRTFNALPTQPAIRRDVALIVDESATHDAVLQAVQKARPEHLVGLELFDVFRGKNVPEGRKSVAYAMTYRHPERTLKDAEADASHQKAVQAIQQALNASVRDS